MKNYYKILGVSESASDKEIKQAYRWKSKQFHPDLNKGEDANEKFLQISEAYEYLTGKKDTKNLNEIINDQTSYADFDAYWEEEERAKARERAEYFAQMRHREFIKSDEYKATQATASVFKHLGVGLTLLVFISPIAGYFYKGFTGLCIGLFIVFATVHLWGPELKLFRQIDIGNFIRSIKYIVTRKTFHLIVFGLLNVLLQLKFGFSTMIPIVLFPLLYAIALLGGYLVTMLVKRLNNPLIRKYILIAISPAILNLFFIVNYVFSSRPISETFAFEQVVEDVVNPYTHDVDKVEMASIMLENNQYYSYPHIRYFLDYSKVKGKHKITYHFEKGLFGLRVMKGYHFAIR